MVPITIRIFSCHPIAASEYSRVLAAEKGLHVVRSEEQIQVGIFDMFSASMEGVLTLARLKLPSMRPLLVTSPCDNNECLRWLFRGAWGLVTYDRYEDELSRAVRQVAEGRLWFPATVVMRWLRVDAAHRSSALRLSLTKREREVMDYLLRRMSNKEIAEILSISERTAKFHVANILTKLHLGSRMELMAKWVPKAYLV